MIFADMNTRGVTPASGNSRRDLIHACVKKVILSHVNFTLARVNSRRGIFGILVGHKQNVFGKERYS